MAEGHIEFTLSMCVCVFILQSCPGHDYDLKIFGTNDYHDKTMCHKQEPYR